jgi:hypothetical protein
VVNIETGRKRRIVDPVGAGPGATNRQVGNDGSRVALLSRVIHPAVVLAGRFHTINKVTDITLGPLRTNFQPLVTQVSARKQVTMVTVKPR